MKTIKYIDFFSGIGGFRIGANQAKIADKTLQPIAFSEIDPLCSKLYAEYFSANEEVELGDITTIRESNDYQKLHALQNFDMFFGGFPCQPFANIGKQLGLNDDRGTLIYNICEILSNYQPSYFILENVQKIRNLQSGAILDEVLHLLSSAGYKVWSWDLCASDYGVPQQRRRMFFCGFRGMPEILKDIPAPSAVKERKFPTSWHLLERDMPNEHVIPSKTRETVLRKNPKWQGDMGINRLTARPLTATMAKWHRANQDNYYSKSFVFAESFEEAKKITSYEPNEEIRRLTFLEGLRLQGFPDDMKEEFIRHSIRPTPAFRLIGNAVPAPLVAAVIEGFFQIV